jgi:hypothetical protein
MKHLFIFFVVFCLMKAAFANISKNRISAVDSTGIYKSIEKFSKKQKLTHLLYKAVFVENPSDTIKHKKLKKEPNYNKYKGRIIRNIEIKTYDPFGYNVRDTSIHPNNSIQKSLNFLHQKSRQSTIKNQLIIRRNDPLDLLKLKESERIIRKSVYVRDVTIKVMPIKGTDDSVDVFIFEQDVWSKTFGIGISDIKYSFSAGDKNLLGLAHQVNNKITYDKITGRHYVEGTYSIPYIKNSYVVSTIFFNSNHEQYIRGVSIIRPFYSTLTKWAGGLDILSNKKSQIYIDPETGIANYSVRFNNIDTWVARSFQLADDTSELARNTRVILSMRYQNIIYHDINISTIDPENVFENTNLFLGTIGLSSRNYYHDYYIYRFGTPEDVPAGRLISTTLGYEYGKSVGRIYTGINIGAGNHFDKLGYFSVFGGWGTFWNGSKTEQSVLNGSIGYFSNLFSAGRWHLRQFIKTQAVFGFDRKTIESINLNLENGLRGFESERILGTKKLILSLQTQGYAPFSFIGFKFAPFIYCDFGIVGNENSSLFKSRVYQTYGIGLIIKNELLIINNFQFTVALYPIVPGVGRNIFKFDPVRSYDFTFNDFEIDKPTLVPFQ